MDIQYLKKQVEEGVWKDVPGYGGKENSPQLKLKRLGPKEQKQARKASRRNKFVGRVRRQEVDDEALNVELLDRCVTDWKNISDGGKPLEVTRENKAYLDAVWPAFSGLWNAFMNDEAEDEAEEREETLGNSGGGRKNISTLPPAGDSSTA